MQSSRLPSVLKAALSASKLEIASVAPLFLAGYLVAAPSSPPVAAGAGSDSGAPTSEQVSGSPEDTTAAPEAIEIFNSRLADEIRLFTRIPEEFPDGVATEADIVSDPEAGDRAIVWRFASPGVNTSLKLVVAPVPITDFSKVAADHLLEIEVKGRLEGAFPDVRLLAPKDGPKGFLNVDTDFFVTPEQKAKLSGEMAGKEFVTIQVPLTALVKGAAPATIEAFDLRK